MIGDNMIKLDDIYKKYPFIYEVKEDYFFIGWGICKQCNSSIAIEYYLSYRKKLCEIGNSKLASGRSDLDEEDMEALLFYFQKVKAYSDLAVDKEEWKTFRKRIDNMISLLSEEQKNKLFEQLKDFVNVFHYYYRKF